MAMENLPWFVSHTTAPLTGCGRPPMMTFVSPAAAGAAAGLDDGAGADEVAELEAELEEVPEDFSSFEHPAMLTTRVVALRATNSSRFTGVSFD
ncbi:MULTISPECIES: hypothetical protein [unclassified Mycobacterium]|uniref:hypothetical protein n=1 Tax=unclassified Mycobacterium TaxID=2642494 RepID=UPI00274266B3|nr:MULTISPECIES: hypothetical protein [unclassified Mycobacterium]MDP7703808.1 hypothetical protein [Mycobacterium sp. TY815]MDP7722290.1 hypothetical protein [Mycobacterium sp. TY814]